MNSQITSTPKIAGPSRARINPTSTSNVLTPISLQNVNRSTSSLNTTTPRRFYHVDQDKNSSHLEQDDDAERAQLRVAAQIRKRLSQLPSSSPALVNGTPVHQNVQNMGQDELMEKLNICVKMFLENKITVRNVWDLPVIEFMQGYLQLKDPSKDPLVFASSTLDVGAKVYGMRVDDLHLHVTKLAKSLTRFSARQADEDGSGGEHEDGGDHNVTGGENANKRKSQKKKRKKTLKCTIPKDPSVLLNKNLRDKSGFFQTISNSKLSMVFNLFTTKLPINHLADKFMLHESCPHWIESETERESAGNNVSLSTEEKEYKKNYSRLYKLNEAAPEMSSVICIQFEAFAVDEWDPDLVESFMDKEPSQLLAQDLVFDKTGLPIAELDSSITNFDNGGEVPEYHDDDEADLDDVATQRQLREKDAQIGIQPVFITSVFDTLLRDTMEDGDIDEYSYLGGRSNAGDEYMMDDERRMVQVWAGPSHWKLKGIRRAVGRFSGKTGNQLQQQAQTKKTKALAQPIDFFAPLPPISSKRFKCRKLPQANPEKITLPMKYYLEKNDMNLDMLFLKDATVAEMRRMLGITTLSNTVINNVNNLNGENNDHDNVNTEIEVAPYNYDNANDSQYCPSGVDLNNDDGDDGDTENHYEMPQQSNLLSDCLVEMPDMVTPSYMPYPQYAKKMDMKKLKNKMWNVLLYDDKAKDILTVDTNKRIEKPVLFSHVCELTSEILPIAMKTELSKSLAFVALLHLANEQSLHLVNLNNSNKDIIISQGQPII